MKKYEIVYNKYKYDILHGFLKKGNYLPSIRNACKHFELSKTTIQQAYDKLVFDGFIESIEKVGYVVCMDSAQIDLYRTCEDYSNKHETKIYDYDFRSQSVSYDSFETRIWKRYLKQILDQKVLLSSYGDSQGEPVLRQALCDYAYQNRGILAYPDQVVVGSNYQTLLFLFCGMLDHDLVIGVCDNVDIQALHVFDSYGFKIETLNSEHLIEDIIEKNIDVLYINTTCFGKMHRVMDQTLRKSLIELEDVLILEDDYNGELAYATKLQYSLFSKCDHVIYFSSFSRLVLPSLRISYMILNDRYLDKYKTISRALGPSASKIEQSAFAQYIIDGHLQKHVRKLIREYRDKSIYMHKLLNKSFDVDFYLNEAYMSYWCNVDDPEKLVTECMKRSIAIDIKSDRIELSFAYLSKEKIKDGLSLLAQIYKEC